MFDFLTQKKKWLASNKKFFAFCFATLMFCVTISCTAIPQTSYGEEPPEPESDSWLETGFNISPIGQIYNGTKNIGVSSAKELARDYAATLMSTIAEALLRLTSLLLYVSGMLLKYVIEVSVVDIGRIIDTEGVRSAWSTFRDIANMSFIFIILYIAISTILGTGVNMRKTLVRVVVVALLLNFSFFFTKVAVDASNILSVGFYNQIINSPCGVDGAPSGDIGSAFMCHMGLASIWKTDVIAQVVGNAVNLDVGNIVVRGVMGSLFFLIAAFVFLAASLMFLARFISLIFLFILSPLAFGAMALPNDKYSDKWKEPLIKNCIFAPAFMLTIWATLKVLGTINQTLFPAGRSFDIAGALIGTGGGPPQNAGQTFMNYAIVIGMIIGALIVAEKFGAYGAGGAIKVLDKSRKGIQGAIGRQTIGRAGAALDKSISTSDSRLGRFANTDLGRDIRSFTTGAAAKAKFGSKTDFTKYAKDKKKADEDYAKEIRKKRKDKDQFTHDQLKLNVDKTAKILNDQLEKATRPDTANEREKELETKIAQAKEPLKALEDQQKLDAERLDKSKNATGYAVIKSRMDDRATEIKKLGDKIATSPEMVELKAIKDTAKKASELMTKSAQTAEKQAEDAVKKLAKFEKYNEEEAKRLFTTSGRASESKEKGKKMGLSSRDLEDFMEIERNKYVAEIKKLLEGQEGNKKTDPVRVQLMRDAGEYSKLRGALVSTIRKSLREGEGKKTKDLIKEAAKQEGINVNDEDEGGGDKEGGDKGGGGENKGKKDK